MLFTCGGALSGPKSRRRRGGRHLILDVTSFHSVRVGRRLGLLYHLPRQGLQMQNVQRPINKKFLEKRVVELLGDTQGRDFLKKIYASMDVIKREHVMFRMGKSKLQVYV